MSRKILLIVLLFSLFTELLLTGGLFFFREQSLKQFNVVYNAGNAFLGFIVGWCLVFISLICSYAVFLTWSNRDCRMLCYLLGCWWIGIGVAIFLVYNRPENLVIDSLKGLVIVLLAYRTGSNRKAPATAEAFL
jgi:hypothetical protein